MVEVARQNASCGRSSVMAGITLEDITLVKVGVSLWMGDDVNALMRKNSSGILDMEKIVPLVIKTASNLPVCESLKQRLIDVVEKIGYQLYLFLTKPYIDTNFDIRMIKWTNDGMINGSDTLRELLRETKNCSVSQFRFSCESFDERLIGEIWKEMDESARKFLRQANPCHVFTNYWTGILDDNSVLPDSLNAFMIGFRRFRSPEMNMLWHSIAVNNHAAVCYFIRRLSASELIEFNLTGSNSTEMEILEFLLKTYSTECLPFILGFLEMPIPNEKARELITDRLSGNAIKGILDYVIRRVNTCGDVHYKIFRFLLSNLRHKWTTEVEDNLHFYALSLLSRGRIEKLDFLPFRRTLFRQIMHRLKCKQGLGMFVTIHWNNCTHLLSDFLAWLADDERERELFRESVSAITEGRQYDLSSDFLFST